jgi:CHAT domain-containing protein
MAVVSLVLLTGATSPGEAHLEPGAGVEQQAAPGDVHAYDVAMDAGQYARIEVDQQGVDVVVTVTDPVGRPVDEVDTPGGSHGIEAVSFLTDAVAGRYRVEVRALPSTSGTYEIRLAERRPARPEDSRRIAAERRESEADRHYYRRTPDDLAAALEGYRAALSYWSQPADGAKRASLLYRRGLTEKALGRNADALASLGEALDLQRTLGDRRGQAQSLNQRGLVHASLSQYGAALQELEEASSTARDIADPNLQAPILNNLGLIQQYTGSLRDALATYERVQSLLHGSGDRRREAVALSNLGSVHASLGEPSRAQELFRQSLDLARTTADGSTQAEALNGLGLVQDQLGHRQEALESFQSALALFEQIGDRRRQAAALVNVGIQYASLGDPEQASRLFLQALSLQREVGDRRGEASTLDHLGRAWRDLNKPEDGLKSFRDALAIQRDIGDRAGEALTLIDLSAALPPQDALEPLGRSLTLFEDLGDRSGQARALHRLGQTEAALGHPDEALARLDRALQIRKAIAEPAGEALELQEMARIELKRGNLEAARQRIEPALQLVESLRAQVAADRLRASYFGSLRDAYDLEVEILMALHRRDSRDPKAGWDARAFEASEQARARGLLDLLREARVEVDAAVAPAVREQERKLRDELSAREDRLTKLLASGGSPEATREVEREISDLVGAYEIVQGQIRQASPAYADLTRPHPVQLQDLQLHLLGRGTILLEYFLGDERSTLWRVETGSIAAFDLPGRAEIEAAAVRAYQALSQNRPREAAEQRQALAELSRLLLAPVAGTLGESRLAIVAPGALQYLPFAALPDPSTHEPLIAEHEIVSLPSASVLDELRRKNGGQIRPLDSIAVLADPVFQADDPRVAKASAPPSSSSDLTRSAMPADDAGLSAASGFERLPWTRREAEAISAIATAAGRTIRTDLDFDASRDQVFGLGKYRVIHFATHGLLNSREPELSGLVLSLVDREGKPRNGFLRIHDIYGLTLDADLVVLSGCRTALGREIRGEGLLGLTRGFLYAGSTKVMASLWAVRDQATSELMQRFYRALLVDRKSPAAALREAQLSLRRDARWRDPYFWAGFTLQGDWTGDSTKGLP